MQKSTSIRGADRSLEGGRLLRMLVYTDDGFVRPWLVAPGEGAGDLAAEPARQMADVMRNHRGTNGYHA